MAAETSQSIYVGDEYDGLRVGRWSRRNRAPGLDELV